MHECVPKDQSLCNDHIYSTNKNTQYIHSSAARQEETWITLLYLVYTQNLIIKQDVTWAGILVTSNSTGLQHLLCPSTISSVWTEIKQD